MPLSAGLKQNFDVLCCAFRAGRVALIECQLAATGESAAVICAANKNLDDSVDFVPLAMMFQDNPYTTVNPPKPDGGFHFQKEQQHV